MGVIDLITRVDAICKKYDKYDVDKHKDSSVPGDDTFARLYGVVEADTDAALQKSEAAATEKNRATAVAMNAEIRRTKARLLEELPKLQRLALKKVKGLSKEALEARNDLVLSLKERIEAVPDGSETSGAKQTGGWTASASYTGIKIDSTSGGRFDSEYFQQTEESDKFREEYEIRRVKQDQGLDVIAEGLDTLKNMAHDMNEEMDRQAPLMDEIDDKVDRANTDLRGTNVRLKETVTKLRSKAFNYKEERDLDAALKRYFPQGIDIYFDNVGGEMLDAALLNMRTHGRVAVCGVVSQQNFSKPRGIYNWFNLITKSIKMQGFLQHDYLHLYPSFLEHVIGNYKKGKIVFIEDMNEGLDSAPAAFVGLFYGKNVGKQVIRVAHE